MGREAKLPLVAVTSSLPGDALSLLDGRARVRVFSPRGNRTQEQVITCLRGASGAVTLLSDPLTEKVLARCPALKVVSNCAAGVVVGKVGTATCTPGELLAFMR